MSLVLFRCEHPLLVGQVRIFHIGRLALLDFLFGSLIVRLEESVIHIVQAVALRRRVCAVQRVAILVSWISGRVLVDRLFGQALPEDLFGSVLGIFERQSVVLINLFAIEQILKIN